MLGSVGFAAVFDVCATRHVVSRSASSKLGVDENDMHHDLVTVSHVGSVKASVN